ncbi:hypothetical protein Bbelb_036750 [Branchiostoma belcheri]|nr:hypothetical protein Bbelb_036750 [Branchiostoma belcheri]
MAWQHTYIPLQLAEVEVCSTGLELGQDVDALPPDDSDDDLIMEGIVLPANPVLEINDIQSNKAGRPKKRKRGKQFELGNDVRHMSMSARHTVKGNNREEETDVGDHISTKYKRVDSDTCSLARRPSLDDTPGGLRPRQRPPTVLESLASAPSDQSGTADVTEDRIFHVPLLMKLINEFYSSHSMLSSRCTPKVTMPTELERKCGFGCWEALRCEKCGFTTPSRRLYEEAERVPGHKRGPKPGKKNVQLAIGLTKVPVGSTAVQSLLTSVELSSPTKSSVHNLATGMAGPLVSVAQQALADNRRRLRAVMELRGEQVEDGEAVAVAAAADDCYNNPCYKGFHQKSTQVAFPVREQETDANMLIGFAFANKFGKDGEESTFPKSEPIGNAEEWLAGKVTQQMYQCNESPLLLKSLVADGSGQIYRGAQSATQNLQPDFKIEQQDCHVHASRRQRASVFRANLSSQLLTGRADLLLEEVSDAKHNILDCFSGNHTKCFSVSFVCPCLPAGSDHKPSYLPRKRYLLLTVEDRVELGEVLDYKLSEEKAMKQRYLRSTNSVEAFHRCMHKSLPKSLTFKTLAEMRAYSAVHSAAVGGMGESLARLGQHFGVAPRSGGEAAQKLLQLDKQAAADKHRQQSDSYRSSRKRASAKTVSKRVEKLMSETSQSVHLPHEHPYLRSEDVLPTESISD